MFVSYPDVDFPSARIRRDVACPLGECAGEPRACLWAGSLDRGAVRVASGPCFAARRARVLNGPRQTGSSAQRSASGGLECSTIRVGLARVSTVRATMRDSLTMSHVIPQRIFQALKMCRWNCNVCGVSRKMTKLNYVRLLGGAGLGCGVYLLGSFGAFRSGCAWWQPIPHGSPTMSHVIPPREFQTLKSCCWNCNVCGMSRKMTKLNYVRLWGAQSQFIRASSAAQCR